MRHREFAPPAALRDAIQCFWHERREGALEVLPDGYAEIIFHAGAGCMMDGRPLPSPFVMGLLERPVLLATTGPLDIFGIRCFPWTVYELLGLPSGADDMALAGRPIAALQPLLAACLLAGRLDDAVAAAAGYFLDAHGAVDGLLARAGGAMRAAGGTLPVGQVALAAHATRRTLERRFRHASGRTVKDVSSLIRFEQVRNLLWHTPDASLADAALAFGYTDQPHLSREFKKYSGMTPAAFAQQRRQVILSHSCKPDPAA
jgi:AraC-like DNA-binding protein